MWPFILKRIAALLVGLLSKWKLYALIAALVGGTYTAYTIKIKNLERKAAAANNQAAAAAIHTAIVKLSNKAYTNINNQLIKVNQQCVLNNQANKQHTDQALTDLDQYNQEITKRYDELKKIKTDNVCAHTVIGDRLQ